MNGNITNFKRKAYDALLEWKSKYADSYCALLEGARRVGKSTIVKNFAKNEYKSCIIIDFAKASQKITSCFDDIDNLDLFFLRLQAVTNARLEIHKSVIVFDEVQLFPKARQAIKYLVQDGRYHYIETGSLISIKKNVKDILIPSEEMKINVFPMDYEEFCWATGSNDFEIIRQFFKIGGSVGNQVNQKLMRNFRIYMAVGGMPQAVDAYISKKDFSEIDKVKRNIIALYENDFKKIDSSGRISAIFHNIPSQLSKNTKRFVLSNAINQKKTSKADELLFDLADSKTILISYNTTDPRVSLSSTKDLESYKIYIADTGLFITLMFIDRKNVENEIYAKLLSDKLPANLGYLYENAVAQAIAASGRELYYHTWEKEGSSHYYEIDFLVSEKSKVIPIEVKSSGTGKHESLSEFQKKYSQVIKHSYVLSQKDAKEEENISFRPVYMISALLG